MIFVISGTNYHIFSPLDQHRSGNGPHHPRCPRYVINRLFPLGHHVICQEDCYSTCYTMIFFDRISSLWAPLSHDKSTMCKEIIERSRVELLYLIELSWCTPVQTLHVFWCFLLGLLSREFQNRRAPVLLWKSSFLVSWKKNHNTFWRFHQLVP